MLECLYETQDQVTHKKNSSDASRGGSDAGNDQEGAGYCFGAGRPSVREEKESSLKNSVARGIAIVLRLLYFIDCTWRLNPQVEPRFS